MTIDSTSEVFIFLGKIAQTLFFLHRQSTEMEHEEAMVMVAGIFNALIAYQRIERDESVVVFNFGLTSEPSTCLPICIAHIDFIRTEFLPEDLERLFAILVSIDRPESQRVLALN